MLPPEIHLFGRTRSKPGQGSVLDGLALASDFGFCFQCQVSSRFVLHRPIEITALTGQVSFCSEPFRGLRQVGEKRDSSCHFDPFDYL
jgi:hypothetical protein